MNAKIVLKNACPICGKVINEPKTLSVHSEMCRLRGIAHNEYKKRVQTTKVDES